mmetsp:Transcript_8204/g.23433  ORF Transcript_8204/g.23433 Transcript_8204/m.23433 type:complete len:429 (+) Transcript_8204:196-1482(+)
MGTSCSLGSNYAAAAQVAATAIRSVSPKPCSEDCAQEETDWDVDAEMHLPAEVRGREISSMMRQRAPKDHAFLSQDHSASPPAGWLKRIEREWRVLARGLPPDIHVQMYEDRLDLMRAAIVGPKDTPYSDSLLFFDIYLSQCFPRCPPAVKFWAFKERLNPNLYANGMVCLSLLGTWSGSSAEMWKPTRSNLLQVLVSLQGLVLVEEPYFNEPGFERTRGTIQGSLYAQRYSEDARIKSLRSALRIFEEPLDGYEAIITGHFAQCVAGLLQRLETLVGGQAPKRPQRIDGIQLSSASPSEAFRREVIKLLPSLRRMHARLCSGAGDQPTLGLEVDSDENQARMAPQVRQRIQLRASSGAAQPKQPQQTAQPQLLLRPPVQPQQESAVQNEESQLPEPPDEYELVPPIVAAMAGVKAPTNKGSMLYATV